MRKVCWLLTNDKIRIPISIFVVPCWWFLYSLITHLYRFRVHRVLLIIYIYSYKLHCALMCDIRISFWFGEDQMTHGLRCSNYLYHEILGFIYGNRLVPSPFGGFLYYIWAGECAIIQFLCDTGYRISWASLFFKEENIIKSLSSMGVGRGSYTLFY